MSYPTRRFKPKISRVRSSHSAINQPVKIMRCPQIPEASNANLEETEAKPPRSTYKCRRPSLPKRTVKKTSPPKHKSSKTSGGKRAGSESGSPLLNDDFLEEMKLVGEKLKTIEKELTRKKILGKSPSKVSELDTKAVGKKKNVAAYNPIDFTDMDFDVGVNLSTDASLEESANGAPENPTPLGARNIGHPYLPTNEAVESVIAKIRNDIKTWRIGRGLDENGVDQLCEPSVVPNGRGEIVVREEAERETHFDSNRSSDGVTKANSDSLSSDPPPQLKSKASTATSFRSKPKSSFFPQPRSPSGLISRRNAETSSSTNSNHSIPGIRPKELRYPLDKYLPRQPRREETFIKPRDNEIPIRQDAALFRKIESLLKESQQIRESIVSGHVPHGIGNPADSSVSTEDLVAAEFYKATYGTPKKTEFAPKPTSLQVAPRADTHIGAGDWIPPRNTIGCDPVSKPQPAKEHAREGADDPWNCLHQVVSPPKPHSADTGCHRLPLGVLENPSRAEESSVQDAESNNVRLKMKMSDVFSCSSAPSVSMRTNSSMPQSQKLKKVTMQNACINTDRTNTHVLSVRHDVANDFAVHPRVKSFVVQELPKVNIRGRLVKQRCGVININPISMINEVTNTAVVEVSRGLDEHYETTSPKRGANDCHKGTVTHHTGYEYFDTVQSQNANQCNQQFSGIQPPALSHRLAFDLDAERRKPPTPKPRILDTAEHFKAKLSQEFNAGLEPIKRSLTAMLASLEKFCQIDTNDSDAFLSSRPPLHRRFDQMEDVLMGELRSWGQRDLARNDALKTAIDGLTKEIQTVVDASAQMKSLNERTRHFLEDSTASVQKAVNQMNHPVQHSLASADPLRLDKLYAINSFLQNACAGAHVPPSSADSQERQSARVPPNDDIAVERFGQTFTIERTVQENIDEQEDKVVDPRGQVVDAQGKNADYEDDFMPEDGDQLSESTVGASSTKSTTSGVSNKGNEESKVEEIVLRTSGSANGEESTNAPVNRITEHRSSVASTVNASQANIVGQKPGSHLPIVSSSLMPPGGSKALEGVEDKPLVRLTNRSTNAIFELRLPEQLANLSSTLTYSSAENNDQIKLSIGPERDGITAGPRPSQRVPERNTAEIQQNSEVPKEAPNAHRMNLPDIQKDLVQGLILCPGHLQQSRSVHGFSVRPQQNQSTQFPPEETSSVEQLSADILNMFELKMNEMVETSKQKFTDSKPTFKDVDVQVAFGDFDAGPLLDNRESSKFTQNAMQTPAKATGRIVGEESDGYDSHTKHLARPSDYLLYRQTENEIQEMLQKKSFCPVQMESSLSSVSVPTSLSEFPLKNLSTSSSESAFPLGSPAQIQRLNPVPTFEPATSPCGGADEAPNSIAGDLNDSSLASPHLHPNPVELGLQPEDANPIEVVAELDSPAAPSPNDIRAGDATKIFNLQPYDSDLMSEGEIGYALTSHSYSSGEIVERKKSGVAAEKSAEVGQTVYDPGMEIDRDDGPVNLSTSSNLDVTSSETTSTETSSQ